MALKFVMIVFYQRRTGINSFISKALAMLLNEFGVESLELI